MGDLERVSMRYDISGRSTGEAEVQFHREADALKAYKAFNGRVLDGRRTCMAMSSCCLSMTLCHVCRTSYGHSADRCQTTG